MKPESLRRLKQFLADEWGVKVDQISDQEALRHHRRRWTPAILIVFLVVISYLTLRLTGRRLLADTLFLIVVLAFGVLSAVVIRSPRNLTLGRMRSTKEVIVETLRVYSGGRLNFDSQDIAENEAEGYSRREWKSLVFRVSLLLGADIIAQAVWRSQATLGADAVVLLAVLAVGVLAMWNLWPHRRA